MFDPSGIGSWRSGCQCRVRLVPSAGVGWQGAGVLLQDGQAGGDACDRRAAQAIMCHIVLLLVFKNNNSSTDS